MDELLRSIQMTMLEILKVFDSICRANNIHYSLHGGTLLGAVRHKGFIPWDDDLDVFMTREDYNSFVVAWNKNKPDGYFLQTKETEEFYTRGFAKIRKEHTLFLQEGEDPTTIHTGVFIDIFAVDRVPNKGIGYYFFLWDCMRFQLFTREFVPLRGNLPVRILSKILLTLYNHEQRLEKRKKLFTKIQNYNTNHDLRLAVLESPWHIKHSFSPYLFDSYSFVQFEGQDFMSISKWDDLLKLWYGDYMKMPPVSERVWAHHPKVVNLMYDYQEYINVQKER